MTSETGSVVRRLGVVELGAATVPPDPTPKTEAPDLAHSERFIERVEQVEQAVAAMAAQIPPKRDNATDMLPMFRALGFALSARALLLIAIAGAFVLAAFAMWDANVLRLLLLIAYCAGAVLPCAYLELRKQRPPLEGPPDA